MAFAAFCNKALQLIRFKLDHHQRKTQLGPFFQIMIEVMCSGHGITIQSLPEHHTENCVIRTVFDWCSSYKNNKIQSIVNDFYKPL